MSLTCVKMSEDVWLTCLTHALSTETEEIMGLLLGDIECSKDGNVTALIWGASPQSRSDRRKDRVETNPEQLAAASAQADRMTASTGKTTRVIGWYHSHPHITVLPSHVDVRTQAMYQLLDSGFIGLIFSCFSEDTNKVGRIQVIAFQSSDGGQSHVSGPVALSPVNRSSVIDLESSLSSSENALMTSGSAKLDSPVQDTGDSRSIQGSSREIRNLLGDGIYVYCAALDFSWRKGGDSSGKPRAIPSVDVCVGKSFVQKTTNRSFSHYVNQLYRSIAPLCSVEYHILHKGGGQSVDLGGFFANADANYLGGDRSGGNHNTNNMQSAIVDIDPMDMSESMQEAMHRSNLDMSGAEYVRKEIPLHVLPTSSLLNLDSPLMSFTDLQHVLFEEERAAYNQAILHNMRDGKVHPLSFIHHTSTYQASMCKLIEYCLSPAISALQDRLKENEIRLAVLTDEAKTLETEAFKGSGPISPHHASSHGLRGSAFASQRDLNNSAEPASMRTFAGPGSRSRKRS